MADNKINNNDKNACDLDNCPDSRTAMTKENDAGSKHKCHRSEEACPDFRTS